MIIKFSFQPPFQWQQIKAAVQRTCMYALTKYRLSLPKQVTPTLLNQSPKSNVNDTGNSK